MSAAGWSDDRITTLRTLWLDGLSAAQIAKSLGGVTRNAVIGKVHRLGLSGRAAPAAPGRAPRGAATRPVRTVRAARTPPTRRSTSFVREAPVSAPEAPGLVTDMVRLGAHACKWPIGDPKAPGFSFCGQFAEGRYCRGHEAVGVQRGTAWRADRDPTLRRALAGLI